MARVAVSDARLRLCVILKDCRMGLSGVALCAPPERGRGKIVSRVPRRESERGRVAPQTGCHQSVTISTAYTRVYH